VARILRGEVYWADLNPERGREQAGLRPVVVISHEALITVGCRRWALVERARGDGDPFHDVIVEYRDPVTGRSLLPTVGCYLQMLRPGVRTRPHRASSGAVYHVVEGRGVSVIDGVDLQWGPGNFFSVPPRALHGHASEGNARAILFSFQDVPLLTALGLYRMEA
jgi:gentisate 1,2-dioxygenase